MSSVSQLPDARAWQRIERLLETIPLLASRVLIRTYLGDRKANGIKASTLVIDANALRGFCLHLGQKPLAEAARPDVIAYVNHATRVRCWRTTRKDGTVAETTQEVLLGARTLAQRKEVLKPFFKWLRGTDDPAEVKGLKTRRPTDFIPTDALISREDLTQIIQAHPDVQDKARLALLYESGFRAGEFCALNVGSVQFEEIDEGVWSVVAILPKGVLGLKTGARRIRLFDSVDYLRAWMEVHPRKTDPNAPLWMTWSKRAPGARLTPNALSIFCLRAARKAGMRKNIHPHLWRHSAATERARLGWNEAQMRAFFGWTRNSDMPSLYTHLAGLDCDDMELERRGYKAGRKNKGPALAGLVCRSCSHCNVATATFCAMCRRPVSPDAEAEIEKRRREAFFEEAKRLLQGLDPESLATLANSIRSRA